MIVGELPYALLVRMAKVNKLSKNVTASVFLPKATNRSRLTPPPPKWSLPAYLIKTDRRIL